MLPRALVPVLLLSACSADGHAPRQASGGPTTPATGTAATAHPRDAGAVGKHGAAGTTRSIGHLGAGRATTPSACGVSVSIEGRGKRVHFAGTVQSATAELVTVVAADGTTSSFRTYDAGLPLFAAGDPIDGEIECGGGWQLVCDGLFRDPSGATWLVLSGTGGTKLADGWTATVGKIVSQEQDPNATEKSIRRSHEVDLARGAAQGQVKDGECVKVTDGATTWLLAGSAVSWDGLRPPEGVDYSDFSLIRW